MIAVLKKIRSCFYTARTEVYRHHRLGAGFLHPLHKFIKSERVRFNRTPRQIKTARTLFHRTDAVFPPERRYIITARIPDERHTKFPDKRKHITAEPVTVGSLLP